MVPPAEFTSYYGKPVLNAPVWEPRDIAGYLFLGGLAGASHRLLGGRTCALGPGHSARSNHRTGRGSPCLALRLRLAVGLLPDREHLIGACQRQHPGHRPPRAQQDQAAAPLPQRPGRQHQCPDRRRVREPQLRYVNGQLPCSPASRAAISALNKVFAPRWPARAGVGAARYRAYQAHLAGQPVAKTLLSALIAAQLAREHGS